MRHLVLLLLTALLLVCLTLAGCSTVRVTNRNIEIRAQQLYDMHVKDAEFCKEKGGVPVWSASHSYLVRCEF